MARKVQDTKSTKKPTTKAATKSRSNTSRSNTSRPNTRSKNIPWDDAPPPRTYNKRSKKGRATGEISTLLVIAFGIIMCFGMYTNLVGMLGRWIKVAFSSSFGSLSYIAPILIVAVGIHIGRTKRSGRFGAKYWLTFFLMVVLSSLWHSFSIKSYAPYTAIEIASNAVGGGFFGALTALPLTNFMGQVGAIILLLTISIILTTIVFDFSLVQAVTAIKNLIGYLWNGKEDEEDYDYEEEINPTLQFEEPVEKPTKKLTKKLKVKDKPEPEKPLSAPNYGPTVPPSTRPVMFDYEKAVGIDDGFGIPASGSVLPKKTFATLVPNYPDNIPTPITPIVKPAAPLPTKEELQALSDKTEQEIEENLTQAPLEKKPYVLPPLSLLNPPQAKNVDKHHAVLEKTAKKLLDTLSSFGVDVKISDYSMGPTVTRYELQPQAGVKISKIVNLADDIALNLAANGVRIEAPIPGKAAIGIEIPNQFANAVNISEVLGAKDFSSFSSKLAFALGEDISGNPVVVDIARMPHLLIAGSTGSGKSVCINTLITSLLYKAMPDEVKLILIDPKMVELGGYNGIPHLLIPVVTDPGKAAGALAWAVKEMTNRYKMFAQNNVRDLKGYNTLMDITKSEKMPQVVIIIDELADLMMVAPNDVEDSICRLAQMARAAGMHLVIATQRPSVDVITGIIKANIPSRISFAVSSQIDSRTILDMVGAEKLIGRGDMLYSPIGSNKPIRVQGALVTDNEVSAIVEYAKQFSVSEYDEEVAQQVNSFEASGNSKKSNVSSDDSDGSNGDELLPAAIEMAIEAGQASVAMYQRRLKVGYQRAARLIDQMEERGIIGRFEGTKPRQILITRQQFQEMMMNQESSTSSGGE